MWMAVDRFFFFLLAAVGGAVRDIRVGDRVIINIVVSNLYGPLKSQGQMLSGGVDGKLHQYATVPAQTIVKVPDECKLNFVQLTSLVCTGATVWNSPYGYVPAVLFERTGGVSITRVQAAGAERIATSSSDEKLKFVKEKFGVGHVINYDTTPNWANEVRRLTNGERPDYVIEIGGAGTIEQNITTTASGGMVAARPRTVAVSYHAPHHSKHATQAARSVVNALQAHYDTAPNLGITTTTVAVLLFDVGSRGNPGPGGSGSVLVELDPSTSSCTPIWLASVTYGDKRTTNNMAEYRGLLHGLLRARHIGIRQLHVVGSKMIINQVVGRPSPKAQKLIRLYWQCRLLLDYCGVQTWTHHYRTFNKNADALANLAMDTMISRQIFAEDKDFPRSCWDSALRHAPNDLSEWQTRIPGLAERRGRLGLP